MRKIILLFFVVFSFVFVSQARATSPVQPSPIYQAYIWVNQKNLPEEISVNHHWEEGGIEIINKSDKPLYLVNTDITPYQLEKWPYPDILEKIPKNTTPSFVFVDKTSKWYKSNGSFWEHDYDLILIPELMDNLGDGFEYVKIYKAKHSFLPTLPSKFLVTGYWDGNPVQFEGVVFYLPVNRRLLLFLGLVFMIAVGGIGYFIIKRTKKKSS